MATVGKLRSKACGKERKYSLLQIEGWNDWLIQLPLLMLWLHELKNISEPSEDHPWTFREPTIWVWRPETPFQQNYKISWLHSVTVQLRGLNKNTRSHVSCRYVPAFLINQDSVNSIDLCINIYIYTYTYTHAYRSRKGPPMIVRWIYSYSRRTRFLLRTSHDISIVFYSYMGL